MKKCHQSGVSKVRFHLRGQRFKFTWDWPLWERAIRVSLFFAIFLLSTNSSFGPLARGFRGEQVSFTGGDAKYEGEPDYCGVASGASQWFIYQPPIDGLLTLSTRAKTNSGFLGGEGCNSNLVGRHVCEG